MSFTNQIIAPEAIPQAAELAWTPMPPEYTREVRLQSLITLGVFLTAAIVPALVIPFPAWLAWLFIVIPMVVLFIGVSLTWLALKRVKRSGYALREHDLAFRRGVIFRKQVILPFNRIQHVEVSSGPLQRRFGLASLKCFTAGGAAVDLQIVGLRKNDAEKLRELILSKSAAAQER